MRTRNTTPSLDICKKKNCIFYHWYWRGLFLYPLFLSLRMFHFPCGCPACTGDWPTFDLLESTLSTDLRAKLQVMHCSLCPLCKLCPMCPVCPCPLYPHVGNNSIMTEISYVWEPSAFRDFHSPWFLVSSDSNTNLHTGPYWSSIVSVL